MKYLSGISRYLCRTCAVLSLCALTQTFAADINSINDVPPFSPIDQAQNYNKTCTGEKDVEESDYLLFANATNGVTGINGDNRLTHSITAQQHKARVYSCFITVETLIKKQSLNEVMFVDVRKKTEFEKYSIPGSVNMPLYTLKTKRFLQGKNIVMINEGYGYEQLEHECQDLRNAGYKNVSILYGGINTWISKNGHLPGDKLAQQGANKISPNSFMEEIGYSDWVVVDSRSSKTDKLENYLPDMSVITNGYDRAVLVQKVKNAVSKAGKNSMASILLVDDNGDKNRGIEKSLSNAGVNNIFLLEGGLDGFLNAVHKRKIMKSSEQLAMNNLKDCSGR